jgi:hypothetical protein
LSETTSNQKGERDKASCRRSHEILLEVPMVLDGPPVHKR